MNEPLHAQLNALSQVIQQETGLSFGTSHYPALTVALLSEMMLATASSAREVAQAVEKLTPLDLRGLARRLAQRLANGETYFFRHTGQFELLKTELLERCRARAQSATPSLRVWSAATSTGEEAYSLAMTLFDAYAGQSLNSIDILATDINERSLELARVASYGEWSFRGVDRRIVETFFTSQGVRRLLRPDIRSMCRFAQHNLKDPPPSVPGGFDVIFCRNVLQYFDFKAAREVIAHLRQALSPQGVLVVAPAENSPRLFLEFGTFVHQNTTYYGKQPGPSSAAPRSAIASTGRRRPRPNASAVSPSRPLRAAVILLSRAQFHANAGRPERATLWAERAARLDPLRGAPFIVCGAAWMGAGEWARAEEAFLHATQIAPSSPVPHSFLAQLARASGNEKEALNEAQRAISILQALPPKTLLPEADGASAEQLMTVLMDLFGINERSV